MSTGSKPTLLLVGCGKMGGALLRSWHRRDLASLAVIDPSPPPDWIVAAEIPWAAQLDNLPHGFSPSVIVLAVKPQVMEAVAPSYAKFAPTGTLYLSIAAGRTLDSFARIFGPTAAIVRTMPNTPAAIGKGVTGCVANDQVSRAQRDLTTQLLEGVGQVHWLADEASIDIVTAISGSGPAYLFLLVEVLAKAGEAAGLPASLAMSMARATIEGSGALLEMSEEAPDQLRRNVTSPNGTTAAALEVFLQDDALQRLVTRAVKAGIERSRALAA